MERELDKEPMKETAESKESSESKEAESKETGNATDTATGITMSVAISREEMKVAMEKLQAIFQIVRLVDGYGNVLSVDGTPTGETTEDCQCFAFWQKDHKCVNCIAQKALIEKQQKIKLEFMESGIYQVIAKYVEIDQKACVLELINPLDEDVLVDASGREALIKRLSGYDRELYTDALTGVYNRKYFEDRVKMSDKKAGVAMIDMDDFKLYNDTYGHNAGDTVLDVVVGIIKDCIRKTDILIRYGGDEFLLVLPQMQEESFTEKLKQIRQKIHEAKVPGYTQIRLSVSIGGVMTDGQTVGEAVMRADSLMYQAKINKDMVVTEESVRLVEGSAWAVSPRDKKKLRVLLVDDSQMNREILSAIIAKEYEILEAENGEEALRYLREYETGIALVLLDIVMPVMDGFEVLTCMSRKKWIEDIPVIMISSEDSLEYIKRAFDLGASDYIKRPFDAQVVYRRVKNAITLYAKQRRLMNLVKDQVYEKEKNSRLLIGILSQIVEFRNGESGLHVLHIDLLTGMLLENLARKTDKYDLSWTKRSLITTASALHDIGKISIDDKILNKPGQLTKEEFEVIKSHTLIGAYMLERLTMYQDEPLVKVAYEICRWHHERYDGTGYPDGLAGEEIPISAQVVALADVYDALVSERVYKKAYSHETAVRMILNGECGSFNPLLLECLTDIQDKIKKEFQKLRENSEKGGKSKDAARELEEYEKAKEQLFRGMPEALKEQ